MCGAAHGAPTESDGLGSTQKDLTLCVEAERTKLVGRRHDRLESRSRISRPSPRVRWSSSTQPRCSISRRSGRTSTRRRSSRRRG